MKITKILFLFILSLLLIGCNKNTKSIIEKDTNTKKVSENNSDTNKNIEKNTDMKNTIVKKNEVNIEDNSKNIIDLELRNSTIAKVYSEAINSVKDFSEKNSLELIFEEPIEHRISRMAHFGNTSILLQDLQELGAETVSYFTDEDILNVELSIVEDDNTYSHIAYKASIANINKDFNFMESKLNEFRSMLVDKNELNFDNINKYIEDMLNNNLEGDALFFNKIDDDRYESIRIKNNNCYYKLIYNPKL